MKALEQKRMAVGLTVLEAARSAGVGRSTIYEELASGRLKAKKLGRRTIITEQAVAEWMAGLPAYRSPAIPRLKGAEAALVSSSSSAHAFSQPPSGAGLRPDAD